MASLRDQLESLARNVQENAIVYIWAFQKIENNSHLETHGFAKCYECLQQNQKKALICFISVKQPRKSSTKAKGELSTKGRRSSRLEKILKIRNVALSTSLHAAVLQWHQNLHHFFKEDAIPSQAGSVTCIYWRLSASREKDEFHTIRHRFDCLALYHMALNTKDHSRTRWAVNGLNLFARLVHELHTNDHSHAEKVKNVKSWVEAGRYYQAWIDRLTYPAQEDTTSCGT